MPQNTIFYVDDVSIPVSWYTVAEGVNDMVYFRVNAFFFSVQLNEGNYSLVTLNQAIVDKLNVVYPNDFVSDPNVSRNTVRIKTVQPITFQLLTDALTIDNFASPLNSVNNILRNKVGQSNNNSTPYESGFVDLFPVRNLYIVSPNLGNHTTMTVWGEMGVIKKVPVTATYNEMIFDQAVIGSDYLDCSRQTLSRLEFQLKDAYGKIVELNDNHWSFSLVFAFHQPE